MDKRTKIANPVYQQIATDLAYKIVDKQYKVGDKIYARSYIASQYGVSSETARRAICMLSDLNIVETTKGSGVIIKSYEKAAEFIRHYSDMETVNHMKKAIFDSVERQKNETTYLKECLTKLIEKTDRFQAVNPFIPNEIEITEHMPYLNKTISEMNFWHNTAATIVAIKRSNELFMSPGPYAILLTNDTLYFVGDENCYERVKNFLYPN